MAKTVLGTKHVQYKIAERTIMMRGAVRKSTPGLLKKALDAMLKTDENGNISVFIESEGGDFYSAVEAHQVLGADIKPKIYTIAGGHVDSCALLILQGGNRRLSYPDARFGVHRTSAFPGRRLNAIELSRLMLTCLEKDAVQKLILTERGRPVKKIIEMFYQERTLTAKEALRYKLIDEIIAPGLLKP